MTDKKETKGYCKEHWDKFSPKVKEAAENPWVTLGVGFGLGLLVGMLTRKK